MLPLSPLAVPYVRPIFIARCYASAVYAVVVCPSVCLSITRRCSTKMAKLRIMQTPPTIGQRLWLSDAEDLVEIPVASRPHTDGVG